MDEPDVKPVVKFKSMVRVGYELGLGFFLAYFVCKGAMLVTVLIISWISSKWFTDVVSVLL